MGVGQLKVTGSKTPGHANIKGNEEADRPAKEASLEAAAMKSDTEVVTMADIKHAAVKMGLTQWQRQWESSETGRTLFRYKPKVTDRSQIDYPNTISYRNIAKLRLGYNQLRDYQFKLGISNNNLCECNVVVVVCLFWHSSAAYKLIVLFSLVLLSLAAILMYLLCICVRSALISKICASI